MKRMTTELVPVRPPRLSTRQYDDLTLIREWEEGHPGGAALAADGHLPLRFNAISRAGTARLLARGWLLLTPRQAASTPGQYVTVSYAGRIAMALYEHRTRLTTTDLGMWQEGAQLGHEYVMSCSCGHRTDRPSWGPDLARAAGRRHRREQLQAALEWAASA